MSFGSGFDTYTRVSYSVASRVIRGYSTSFSLATSALKNPDRDRIRALYAIVRITDEIVDGAAPAPPQDQLALVNDFQDRLESAARTGFSTDMPVHAFAHTARQCGITRELWAPFFDAMRSDIEGQPPLDLDRYIHGSAEVVGLMCVRIFFRGAPPASPQVEEGARALGNAFQRINFLRDYGHDARVLNRTYVAQELTDQVKREEIAHIRQKLAVARPAIDLLPGRARLGVLIAHDLFAELTDRIEQVPASELMRTRISVPPTRKAALAARAMSQAAPRRGRAHE